MRRFSVCLALLMLSSMVPMAMADSGHHDRNRSIRTYLSGFNEVHFSAGPPATLRGAVSTAASGKFVARIDGRDETIRYELKYRGLEGEVRQAHIHFGQQRTVGGIVVWLCQTDANPAPDSVVSVTPFCPQEGTVTGTIAPAQVLAATPQGINDGEFAELVRAIRAGAAYVNVHSSLFPPGEIRGQFPGSDDDD